MSVEHDLRGVGWVCGLLLLPAGDHIMFGFYSNRLGCLGSIAVSIIGTLILALLMWSLSGRL